MGLKKHINRNVILLVVAALLVVVAIIASNPTPRPAAAAYSRQLDEVLPL